MPGEEASARVPSPVTADVWTFALDLPDAAATRLDAFLSAEERDRSGRFFHARDARRFRAAHGRLREILAFHLAVAPQQIVLADGPHGKPYVATPVSPLRFSLSHSHGLAAVAVLQGAEIGVDIERVGPRAGTEPEDALSPRERAVLSALAGSERQDAFYRCWTRKEALLKAHGGGLGVPLDSFDVPVGREADDVILHLGGGKDLGRTSGQAGDRGWRVVSFIPAPGFAGAVAIAADPSGVHAEPRWRTWPER
jgi:4'-phosphopantetheinyl transferase